MITSSNFVGGSTGNLRQPMPEHKPDEERNSTTMPVKSSQHPANQSVQSSMRTLPLIRSPSADKKSPAEAGL
jgi:hypothetical protein